MLGQQPLVLGMTQDGLQCAKAARRDARAASGLASTSSSTRLGSFAVPNVGLHLLDLGNGQVLGVPLAEQRLDVRIDPALVHLE